MKNNNHSIVGAPDLEAFLGRIEKDLATVGRVGSSFDQPLLLGDSVF